MDRRADSAEPVLPTWYKLEVYEEGTSTEKMPLPVWSAGKFVGAFSW